MKKNGILLLISLIFPLFALPLAGNSLFVFSDFNDGRADRNSLGNVASSFQKDGGICTYAAENRADLVHGLYGYSLRLDYDVRVPNSFSGYWTKLHGYDLSGYEYLSFYIRGATGAEFLKVQIKVLNGDADSKESYVFISDFIQGGLSADWRKVVIPLDCFINLKSRTQVDELVFVFENYQSSMNASTLKSSVFIDDLVFGTRSPGYLTVDNFSDIFPPLAVGGNTGTGGDKGTLSFSIDPLQYPQYPNSLKLDYNVATSGAYAYYFMILGGGSDGWQKINKDLRDYSSFAFSARAASSAANPCGMKIEIHDFAGNGTGEPFYVITNSSSRRISTNWQEYRISLSSFRDWDSVVLDLSKVQEVVFTFENANASNKSGTVYIDSVRFEAAGFTNTAAVPSAPTGLSDNGSPLSDNFVLNNTSRLSVSAGSSATDPLLECVRFEYSRDNRNWSAFRKDYDLSDTVYEAQLDPDAFSAEEVYFLRVVAENMWGNTAVLGPYKSVKFSGNGFSTDRPGQLIEKLSVDNNPFSPDNDGVRDSAFFNFRLSSAADVSLKILDQAGSLVFKKELGRKAAGMIHTFEWNGKDVNNRIVKNGMYYYRMSAKGTNGKEDKIIQVIGVIK